MKLRRKRKYQSKNRNKFLFWLALFGFVLILVYFGWQTHHSLHNLGRKQVYLFAFAAQPKIGGNDRVAILIKSLNPTKTDELVWLDLPQSSNSFKGEKTLAYYSSLLKIPIDEVIQLAAIKNENKLDLSWELIKQLLSFKLAVNSNYKLVRNFNLVINLIDVATVESHQIKLTNLSNIFLERSLTQDQSVCAVAVINTTSINKLAQKVTNMLESNGLYVVRTTSNEQNLDVSQVLVDRRKPHCRLLALKLEDLLPEHQVLRFAHTVNDYRADIVILLGNNLAQQTIFNSSNDR